jgi:ATP-dependent Lon protease
VPVDGRTRELEREYRAVVEEILELRGDDGRIAAFSARSVSRARWPTRPATRPTSPTSRRSSCSRSLDVTERLARALELQRERLAELQVRTRIRDDVESGAEKQQREYFLRKQMESIRKELGEDDGSSSTSTARRSPDAGIAGRWSASRPSASSPGSSGWASSRAESSMIRSYLALADLGAMVAALGRAARFPCTRAEVLDADHAGLDDVKDRKSWIVHRRAEAAAWMRGHRRGTSAPERSWTLLGPPERGKTSIVRVEFARATGRGVRPDVARRR